MNEPRTAERIGEWWHNEAGRPFCDAWTADAGCDGHYLTLADTASPSEGVYIGPIRHDAVLCGEAKCTCWCQVCERHNAQPDTTRPVEPLTQPDIAAGYGAPVEEQVAALAEALHRWGYMHTCRPKEQKRHLVRLAQDAKRLLAALPEGWHLARALHDRLQSRGGTE